MFREVLEIMSTTDKANPTKFVVDKLQTTFVNSMPSCNYSTDITVSTLDGYEDLNHMFDIAFGIVSMIFMPIIIIGNLLVIISFFKFKRLQKMTGMFICSLALSDLLLGLITLPLYAWFYTDPQIRSNKTLCLLKYSSVIFSLSSSLVNMVVIAVDRYLSIIRPLQYPVLMTKQKAKFVISGIWIYHCIICSLPSLGWNTYDKYNGTVCDFFVVLPKSYTVFTTPVTIVLGLLLSSFLYTHIYIVVKDHTAQMKKRKEIYTNRQFRKDARSAKAMGIIFFFFFIFWVPFMLTAPLKYLNMAKNLMNIIKNVTLTITMLNSVINPFMYCWLRQDFKCAFRELLGNYRKASVQLYSSIFGQSLQNIQERINNVSNI